MRKSTDEALTVNCAVPVAFAFGCGGAGNSPPEVRFATYTFDDALVDDPPQASAAATAIRLILRMGISSGLGLPLRRTTPQIRFRCNHAAARNRTATF